MAYPKKIALVFFFFLSFFFCATTIYAKRNGFGSRKQRDIDRRHHCHSRAAYRGYYKRVWVLFDYST